MMTYEILTNEERTALELLVKLGDSTTAPTKGMVQLKKGPAPVWENLERRGFVNLTPFIDDQPRGATLTDAGYMVVS